MPKVKYGATMYPCLRCLVWKHDIDETEGGSSRDVYRIDELFNSSEDQTCTHMKVIETGN